VTAGRFLIVKTGSTLPELAARRGDYEDWIRDGLRAEPSQVTVAPVDRGAALPEAGEYDGVVVTGSSALVSDRRPWSERTAAWLAGVVEAGIAVLGICYGHQLLAHALGGRVGPNPRGREIGTARVELRPEAGQDELLAGSGPALSVQTTHVESVLDLPPGARCLGASHADPHHVIAIGRRCWGLQFHPEFDEDIMRAYLRARSTVLAAEGLEPGRLLADVQPSPDGPALLARFAEIAAADRGSGAG